MYDRKTTACFTGHRPDKLGGYHIPNPVVEQVRTAATWKIWDAYQRGYRTFISGYAQGFDQLVAELVVRLRKKDPEVRLIAAVPHKDQPKPWPLPAQLIYHDLLEQANEVHILFEDETFFNWMLHARNEWMVDRSDLLIAAWDGSRGGTENCIRYAQRRELDICYIDVKMIIEGVFA